MRSYKGPGQQWHDPWHNGIKEAVEQIDDGRWHHAFGASWIKTTDICLERARREHFKEGWEDFDSDAASIGTSVHAGIEQALMQRNEGVEMGFPELLAVFNVNFSLRMAGPTFRWVNYDEQSARDFGAACLQHWYNGVMPDLPVSALLETRFDLPFFENDERVIRLTGTIDYLGADAWTPYYLLDDWKTAGRGPYTEWEYKRWAIQPTIYTFAAHEMGLVEPLPWPSDCYGEDCGVPFEYVVMHEKGYQRFTVHRGHDDWSWLREKAEKLALLIEADLPSWPVNDNQALCSAKWCPAWDSCKGAHGIDI